VRLHRSLWLWLGGLFLTLCVFLAALALADFTKEPHYALLANPWMVAAGISFLVAFAAFLGAAQDWTFLPVLPIVLPGFPDITMDIDGIGSTDTERESSSGLDVPVHLRSFHVRFANGEQERSAKLTVAMYIKVIAGSWGQAAEVVCLPPTWTLPPSLGLTPMSMPFDLTPGQESHGQLVFEIPRYYLDKIAIPLDARLEITDHASGQRMSIAAQLGHHETATMTPAPGGPQTLGPEFRATAGGQPAALEGSAGTAMEQI
jgi:hypothetical protein